MLSSIPDPPWIGIGEEQEAKPMSQEVFDEYAWALVDEDNLDRLKNRWRNVSGHTGKKKRR